MEKDYTLLLVVANRRLYADVKVTNYQAVTIDKDCIKNSVWKYLPHEIRCWYVLKPKTTSDYNLIVIEFENNISIVFV